MEKTLNLGEISKAILDDIIEDHILVCGLDGQVLFANKSLQSYLGYDEEELKAFNLLDLVADSYKYKIQAFIENPSEVPVDFKDIMFNGKNRMEKLHIKIYHQNNYIYIYGNEKYAAFEKLLKRVNSELNKAIKIHKRSLPESFPNSESISFSSLYLPAEKLGGDLYDVFRVDNGLLNDYFEQYVCYIVDVSGHGLDSAMLAIFIKDTISSYFRLKHIPGQLVSPREIMNFVLEQYTLEGYPDEYLVCLFLTVIDLKTNELTYCNAGFHKSPLLIRDGNNIIELNNGGFPISSAIDSDLYNFKNYSHHLSSTMTLFIMSDGLAEQKSNNEEYDERLKNLVTKIHSLKPDDIVLKIHEDFNDFIGCQKISDDITLIVVKVL